MPTYVYETIPKKTQSKPKRFEIQQSMKDDALKAHPETGEPVRRVISGGLEIPRGTSKALPRVPVSTGGGCCGGGCGCH